MKKIAVLAIALALAVGMPLLASDFTFGGDLDWGFGTNFDDQWVGADYNATFDAKAKVDDFNSVGLSLKHDDTTNDTFLEKAQLTTNLGSAFKLPVSLSSYAGYFNFGSEEYSSITGYDLGYLAEFTGARWQLGLALGVKDLVTFEAATSFNFATTQNDIWLGAHGVFGPVSAEVWFENIATGSAGIFGVSALVQLPVMEGSTLKVTAGYENEIDLTHYAVAAAAKFNYSIFGLGLGFNGNQDAFFNKAAVELSLAPVANAGIDVGLELTPEATDTLNNIDASVWYKAGAATWRVGYLYAPDGVAAADTWNAVAVGTGSGFFMKAGLDY